MQGSMVGAELTVEQASGSSVATGSRSGVSRCERKRGSGTASFYRVARGEEKGVRRRGSRVIGRLQKVGRSVLDLK